MCMQTIPLYTNEESEECDLMSLQSQAFARLYAGPGADTRLSLQGNF